MFRPRFTLRQLEYFVAVAEAGTLSGAAQRLHVSQPGLSQAMTDLENALDSRLTVRRKARGVTLTPAGVEALRQAREILGLAEDLEHSTSSRDDLSGALSIGCYVTLAPTVLPELLQGFTQKHPEITVSFTESDSDELSRLLLHGEIDVAIKYDLDVPEKFDRALIDSMDPYILLAADHPLARRAKVSLHDVIDEPMILPDVPPGPTNTLAIFEQFGLSPHVAYRTSTMELARSLVGRGMGYSLMVQRPANDRTYEGHEVVCKTIKEPVDETNILVTWVKDARLNRRASAFVEYCAAPSRRTTG